MGRRYRSIKPNMWDGELGHRSDFAMLVYFGCMSLADDDGRFKADPRFVKAQLFPYRPDRQVKKVSEALVELGHAGDLHLYQAAGVEYGVVVRWNAEQRIDKYTASELPAPPEIRESSRALAPGEGEGDGDGDGDGRGGKPPSVEVSEVWNHYLKWHPRAVADKAKPGRRYGKRLGCIADRLEEGFTVDRLKAAIDGNHYSEFHNGANDRHREYHDITLILRDAPHVEMFEVIEDPEIERRRQAEIERRRDFASAVRLRLVPPEPGKTIDDYLDEEESG